MYVHPGAETPDNSNSVRLWDYSFAAIKVILSSIFFFHLFGSLLMFSFGSAYLSKESELTKNRKTSIFNPQIYVILI